MKRIEIQERIFWIMIGVIILFCMSCSSESDPVEEPPETNNAIGEVTGMVLDQDDYMYENVKINLKEGSSTFRSRDTDDSGVYQFTNVPEGNYSVEIELPLSTIAVGSDSKSVSVQANSTSSADFTIRTQPVEGTLVHGAGDLLGEVRNAAGSVPSGPSELLFAVNVFTDQAMVPLLGPDGMQVTLGEWDNAAGTVDIYCDGDTSHLEFTFTGLLPEGVYTLWVGPMDGNVILGTGALGDGSGTDNVLDVDSNGDATISISMEAGSLSVAGSLASCVLTSQVDIVLILDYHIDGKTYGSSPGADHTDVGHLLFIL